MVLRYIESTNLNFARPKTVSKALKGLKAFCLYSAVLSKSVSSSNYLVFL